MVAVGKGPVRAQTASVMNAQAKLVWARQRENQDPMSDSVAHGVFLHAVGCNSLRAARTRKRAEVAKLTRQESKGNHAMQGAGASKPFST